MNEAAFPNFGAIYVSVMDSSVNFPLKSIAVWQTFQSGERALPIRHFKDFRAELKIWDVLRVGL
jgi:hypothetical protein